MINELINKHDTFEIVRDQISAILKIEITNQKLLAVSANLNPDDWDLEIYNERFNPWEKFLNQQGDKTPIVNVWFDNSTFDRSSSNAIERQQTEGFFNIDCYAFGLSQNENTGGHKPGDLDAALRVQRTVMLVRNILMAGTYTYLGLQGLVGFRWPQAVTMFQPENSGQTVQNIMACRLALKVTYNEFSPQVQPENLELLTTGVFRAEDGQILFQADYEYPLI